MSGREVAHYAEFLARCRGAEPARVAELAREAHHPGLRWRGPQPINDLESVDGWLDGFWRPLAAAMPDVERRDGILITGAYKGRDWTAATGHYVGTFERDWLGIPATGGVLSVRYGEFCRHEAGRVAEAYVLLDVLDAMLQAGAWPLPPSPGTEGAWPAPATQDGLAPGRDDGEATLRLVEAMIAGLMAYDGRSLASMGQERFWEPRRMMWYGPASIGTTRGLRGFQAFHQGPFLHAFPDRRGGDHKARVAQGAYAASTGWPSVAATHAGEYLGVPATGRRVGMRVMDFWRREGDRLVENWVFIDLPDLLLQMGVDLLGRLPQGRRT